MGRLAIVVGTVALLAWAPPAGADDAPGFEVWHRPPGLALRGRPATVQVETQTSDGNLPRSAWVYLRAAGQSSFTRLRLLHGGARRAIPDRYLGGRFVDDYVVVQDSATNTVRRVPATGSFRTWIRDSFHAIDLGTHVFGRVRAPDAIVARAEAGDGADRVGFHCPPEGLCDAPTSFDVGPRGEVWVTDQAHERLIGWTQGHPGAPSRRFHVPIGMADVAIGPRGTVFVSGVLLGDPVHRISLYAYQPDGVLRWHSHLLTQLFDARLRFGPDGVLYAADPLVGWVPATGADGHPLTVPQQRRLALADQPVPGGRQLVVRRHTSHDLRVALAAEAGALQRAWDIRSDSVLDDEGAAGVAGGDPVLVPGVFDVRRHLEEHVIIRLAPEGGVAHRFSVGPGLEFGGEVTTLRLGSDGSLYQLQGSADVGIRVARYDLG
ncbi:MAG TPA: hypothetical protein VID47_11160 [Actinomycetota bacterium]|jgi:hypothetical protein